MEIQKLKLKKLHNTRDLGGLPTGDGRTIRYGKLIRSGKLYNLPEETVERLNGLGLSDILDLRIGTERESWPDVELTGVKNHWLPLLCTATPGITREKSMAKTMYKESRRLRKEFGSADNYMIQMYQYILFMPESQQCLKKVLRLIIDAEGGVLWHCSGGKDRAGLVAMLVECLLGVELPVVYEDYKISYHFHRRKYFWNKFGMTVVPFPPSFRSILFALMDAKQKYIQSAVEEIIRRYGSVREYCRVELDISDEDVEKLKAKYLE